MYRYILIIICFGGLATLNAQPLVIAHRGASQFFPENTLLAFTEAIKAGADYIELDVHQTKDNMLVVMHDLTINRTCEIPVSIKQKYKHKKISIKELSSEDFLALKIKKQSVSPPSLDSVIKSINGQCKLLIEIKRGSDYYPDIEKHILELIQKNNAQDWVNVIHSFNKNSLLKLSEKQTGIQLQKLIVFRFPLGSFNFSGKINKDDFSNWGGVNSYYLFTSKRLIKKLHQQNKTVFAWTVNKPKWVKKLQKRGVDGIITNNPAMVKENIGKK